MRMRWSKPCALNSTACKTMSDRRTSPVETLAYFGSGGIALALGILVLAWPAALPWLFWGWLLCVDGPHLLATWWRIGGDPARQAQHAEVRRRARWVIALPLGAWVLARAWPASRAMELLLGAGTLWSWYHLTRQHHGILCLLQARHDERGDAARAIELTERRALRRWLWGAFVLSAVATPANRAMWQAAPADLAFWNAASLAAALFVIGAVAPLLRAGARRRAAGLPLRPWWFAVGPVGTVSTVALLAIGWREPVLAGASGPEQWFMAVTLVTGLVHGLQYLGIAARAQAARYPEPAAGWAARLAQRPALALGLMVLASALAYGALNAARGTLPGAAWWPAGHPVAELALAVYWALFFHHYQVDSMIWHMGRDPELRRELGVA